MQLFAQSQQHRHGHGAGDGEVDVAQNGEGAEQEGQQAGNNGSGAEILVGGGLQPVEQGEGRGIGEQAHAQENAARRERYQAGNAAQQSAQREGAKAGRALMILLGALAPAALKTDKQADRQGDAEPAEQGGLLHGAA